MYKQTGTTPGFKITISDGVKIGNFYIISSKVCMTPTTPLDVGQIKASYSLFGSPLFSNNYLIKVSQRPLIIAKSNKPVALSKPIEFTLDQTDNTFKYQLALNNKSNDCKNISNKINCDISSLDLKQGEKYTYNLTRFYKDTKVSGVASGDLSLLPSVVIVKSSVQNNETVYSKPKIFTIEMNKKLSLATVSLEKIENDKPVAVDSTSKVDGTTITTSISADLTRKTSYRLNISKAEGEDGSTLDGVQTINFQASGGPVVASVNIGSGGVNASALVVVTFDQAISQTQDISKLVSFSGGSATIGRTANQITFQLHGLDRCAAFSLSIAKGLNSSFDIASDDGWSYESRINCRATRVIGYSVQGRPIVAYYYGGGSTTILFTGGIHGTERSSQYILQDWIANLDTNAYKIPADKQVVVVPGANADGLASSTRYNANNVNLDRNFPTNNWIANIDTASGIVVNGGGTEPLSEPETKALANLTISLRPRLEVSFHSQGSLVGANQYGDSIAIGNSYAATVGYASMIGYAEEVMGYSMTGEYEDWMGEQYGIPAILIELPTNTGRYFRYHQTAMWKMVNS